MTDEQRLLMLQGIVHDTDRMDRSSRLLVDAARIVAGTGSSCSPSMIDVGKLVEDLDASSRRDPEFPGLEWQGGSEGLRLRRRRPAAHGARRVRRGGGLVGWGGADLGRGRGSMTIA